MKKLISTSFLAALVVVMSYGCGGNSARRASSNANMADAVSFTIDELLAGADGIEAGNLVEIEGVCTHICQHGGKKIFLMGSDDSKTIRIEAGNLGAFKPECVNSVVKVKGSLEEQRIDESYLVEWENRLSAEAHHGEGEAGCDSEQKARGETVANSEQERINNFRKRIAERMEEEGKNYLSFYHIEAAEYEIL